MQVLVGVPGPRIGAHQAVFYFTVTLGQRHFFIDKRAYLKSQKGLMLLLLLISIK
jgi:hypothetical protein